MNRALFASLIRQALTLISGVLAAWGADHALACPDTGAAIHLLPASAAILGVSASVAWSVNAHRNE
jgi:hypothetical protein